MDVNQFRYFKAVAEYGTVSAAAKAHILKMSDVQG